MKNKLLIGASSPVGYFYDLEKEKGRPNPILETPLSYFLLYDEIWFLSRKICPYNMENLDFVHFIDEDLERNGLPKDALSKDGEMNFGSFPWEDWKHIIAATIGMNWRYDNHARSFKFGEVDIFPTPGKYENLLIDRYIAAKHEMTLVENSANAIWCKEFNTKHLQMNLSEKIFNASVTSIQTIHGPWHPAISDLRNDYLLKEYRNIISNEITLREFQDVEFRVQELSDEFEKIVSNIVVDKFNKYSIYKSASLFLLSLIPTYGNYIAAAGLIKEVYEIYKRNNNRGWVGFLGKAKVLLNKIE